MDPNQNPEVNPAATVADAAMSGAAPVVTTTDPNAADVAPEPTLQAPILDPSALTAPAATPVDAPAQEGPVSIAPSADFQMDAVSTVSAVQNGADGNLAAANNDVMIGQPFEQPAEQSLSQLDDSLGEDQNLDQLSSTEVGSEQSNSGNVAADFNDPEAAAAAEAAAKTSKDEEEDDEPIVAAAPVPGSIGSAKSYADIQRAEAEKAAKVAARQNKQGFKLDKNTIIIIAIAIVAVIGIGVGAFVMFGSSPKPTDTPVAPTDISDEHEYSTLSCKRNLALEEFASYGAISGMQENIFYFEDDDLNGLVTNFHYTYATKALADVWRDKLAADYGVTPNSGVDEDSAVVRSESNEDLEGETEDEKKTTAEMLTHYVNTNDLTVIHGMMIKSTDIKDWLESDAYSDVTYGATENGAAAPIGEDEEVDENEQTENEDGEVIRNLKYYNRLQNSINYTCSISKGY